MLTASSRWTTKSILLGAALNHEKIGAPERSRTPNPQIRSLVLYPIELRARAEKRAGFKGGNNYSTEP